MCRQKRKLWFQCRNSKSGDILMLSEYKLFNQTIQKIIKKSIRVEHSLARNSKENPKSVYAYINSKTTTKESIKTLNIYEETSNDTQSVRKTTTDGAVDV